MNEEFFTEREAIRKAVREYGYASDDETGDYKESRAALDRMEDAIDALVAAVRKAGVKA